MFTITPNSSVCASRGDNITVYCELYFPLSDQCQHSFFNTLVVSVEDGSYDGLYINSPTASRFKNVVVEAINT